MTTSAPGRHHAAPDTGTSTPTSTSTSTSTSSGTRTGTRTGLRTDTRTRTGLGLGLDWGYLLIGAFCIVAGGLVAGVTGPLRLEHGSWTAAYLVLVGGVAQVALGAAQGALAHPAPSRAVVVAELATWNLACLAVIAGTLVHVPVVVDAGGVLLVASLLIMMRAVHGRASGARWAVRTHRLVLVTILVSIPVGLVLAHLRA